MACKAHGSTICHQCGIYPERHGSAPRLRCVCTHKPGMHNERGECVAPGCRYFDWQAVEHPSHPQGEEQNMRYRKRPLEIDAIQWTGENLEEIVEFLGGEEEARTAMTMWMDTNGTTIVLHTLEGDFDAPPGWWVIRGVKGEYYACEDSVFHASYDPVPKTMLEENLEAIQLELQYDMMTEIKHRREAKTNASAGPTYLEN
jgi:hypothetical protein